MIRVQAYIVGRTGNTYHVETLVDGRDTPSRFLVPAKSEDEAAMTAIRQTEKSEEILQKAMRQN